MRAHGTLFAIFVSALATIVWGGLAWVLMVNIWPGVPLFIPIVVILLIFCSYLGAILNERMEIFDD